MEAFEQMLFAARARMRGLKSEAMTVEALHPGQIESWGEIAQIVDRASRGQRLILGLPTDLTKGLDQFSYIEVLAMMNDVVDFALDDMPEERHERYLQRVRERLTEPRR